ncbi:MAG: nicotinate (nicotinamide) nucleotide adenylyltransferase [Acidobacteriaceae bacterium]|nr:nicotinate (nicotinamide) nucleotide adenylyltransferase [Acidobacteriaceae bacterium]
MSAEGRKRICLFGGTFDPIHTAHLRVASEALNAYKLDEILFLPAANPPHKDSETLTDFMDRLRMVEIACEGHPAFRVSRLEAGTERSYTIDTLERFRAKLGSNDELFFLIGADAFAEIRTWKRWKDVIRLVEFIVVSRPGVDYRIPEGSRVLRLDGIDLPVASTAIRSRIAAGEATPELPDAVRRYIDANGLYRTLRAPIPASRLKSQIRKSGGVGPKAN